MALLWGSGLWAFSSGLRPQRDSDVHGFWSVCAVPSQGQGRILGNCAEMSRVEHRCVVLPTDVEELWQQFFADPSQWWDHTRHKVNTKYPDFKHKKTGAGLWIMGRSTPPWVRTELASVTPGLVSKSLYSWHAMLLRYVKSGREKDALELYNQMQKEAVKPDKYVYVTVLNACASLISLDQGSRVHAQVIESGCESDEFVSNALVDMYAKCGSIEDAEKIFHRMSAHSVVSWGAMLTGYVNCEDGQKALLLFRQMQAEGVKADSVIFVLVLKACACIMALEEGRCVHAQIIESGCEFDVFVSSSLVDMYAKCGSIEDAQRVFDRMPTRNVVSWTAMLGGLALHGLGKGALELFQEMNKAGVPMNGVTFICLLSACSRGGFVEEGMHYFESMYSVYGVQRTVDHCLCMVDLFGRAGRLVEAEEFIRREPLISENRFACMALLGACRKHCNLEMGEQIALKVLEMERNNP